MEEKTTITDVLNFYSPEVGRFAGEFIFADGFKVWAIVSNRVLVAVHYFNARAARLKPTPRFVTEHYRMMSNRLATLPAFRNAAIMAKYSPYYEHAREARRAREEEARLIHEAEAAAEAEKKRMADAAPALAAALLPLVEFGRRLPILDTAPEDFVYWPPVTVPQYRAIMAAYASTLPKS